MKIPAEDLLTAAGVLPRERAHVIPREAEISLDELVRAGLKVAALGHEGKVRVRFEAGRPFKPAHGGYQAVRVRASTGAESVLEYEPLAEGRVSGLVRLR